MDQIMYYRTETKLIVVHAEVTGVCGDGNLSCDDCHSAENARKIIIKELSKRAIDITEIPENYMYIPAAHLSRICKATKAGAMFRLQIEEFHNGHGGKRAKPGRKPMKEEEKRKSVTVTLSPESINFLKSHRNSSKIVESALALYIEQESLQNKIK